MAGVDEYVKLLIHSNTVNGSTTFADASASAHALTATSAQHSTSYPGFGATSMVVTGTTGYVASDSTSDFNLGVGDWTFDWRMRLPSGLSSGTVYPFSLGHYNNYEYRPIELYASISSSNLLFSFVGRNAAGGQLGLATFGSVAIANLASWKHFAFERYGGALTLYYNGAVLSSFTTVITTSTEFAYVSGSTKFYLLNDSRFLNSGLTGLYADEFRFSKGIARYQLASYTVPTKAYSIDTTVDAEPTSIAMRGLSTSGMYGSLQATPSSLTLQPLHHVAPCFAEPASVVISGKNIVTNPTIAQQGVLELLGEQSTALATATATTSTITLSPLTSPGATASLSPLAGVLQLKPLSHVFNPEVSQPATIVVSAPECVPVASVAVIPATLLLRGLVQGQDNRIEGELPGLEAEFRGLGQLAGELPDLTGEVVVLVGSLGALVGELPDLEGECKGMGVVQAELPDLEGEFGLYLVIPSELPDLEGEFLLTRRVFAVLSGELPDIVGAIRFAGEKSRFENYILQHEAASRWKN